MVEHYSEAVSIQSNWKKKNRKKYGTAFNMGAEPKIDCHFNKRKKNKQKWNISVGRDAMWLKHWKFLDWDEHRKSERKQ